MASLMEMFFGENVLTLINLTVTLKCPGGVFILMDTIICQRSESLEGQIVSMINFRLKKSSDKFRYPDVLKLYQLKNSCFNSLNSPVLMFIIILTYKTRKKQDVVNMLKVKSSQHFK